MEELGFHRKYRPKTLSEYIGNEKLKQSVKKALETDRKPQVILLSGPAGTGKTTMARLLAKEYLCENRDSVGSACNKCYACQAMDEFIETGRTEGLTNIREVDVTDSNKKQDIDDLLEDASLPSFDGNWKIYILDECHMMTSSAQNRLLKTLEEPPEKVLMILCTTNPEKLLDTIISRCQYKFTVKKPTKLELRELLAKVCMAEKIVKQDAGLDLISAKVDFTPRKALIELENVIRERKSAKREDVVAVLNMVSDKFYFEFFELLVGDRINVQEYIAFLGRIKMNMELSAFMDSIIPFIMRGIYVANGVEVDALDISEVEQYKKLFRKFEVEQLTYLLDTLIRIKESRDIEAKLMLLGYQGFKPIYAHSETVELVDNSKLSAAEEKKAGEEAYEKSITVSEEDKLKKIEEFNKDVSFDFIASNFGGTVVLDEVPVSDNIRIISED